MLMTGTASLCVILASIAVFSLAGQAKICFGEECNGIPSWTEGEHQAEGLELLQVKSVKTMGSRTATEFGSSRGDEADKSYEQFLALFDNLDMDTKKSAWWNITQRLDKANGFPIVPFMSQETGMRQIMNHFNHEIASILAAKGVSNQRCAETGDGHFLKADFQTVCASTLVVDLFDDQADVKMDLNLPPAMAPDSVKAAHGTMDIVLSQHVFEHLQRPSIAIANLNALLRLGGSLVFSTPFVTQDHEGPGPDFFRWTVRGVRSLLECSGFTLQEIHGQGNELEEVAYLAGVPGIWLNSSHVEADCNGLAPPGCHERYYGGVGALATKTQETTLEQVHACYG